MAMIMAPWKRSFMYLLLQAAQGGNEGVSKRRLIDANLFERELAFSKLRLNRFCGLPGTLRQAVNTVTKPLNIKNRFTGPAEFGQRGLGLAQLRCPQFQPLGVQAGAYLGRCAALLNFSLIN